jgi:transposase
MTLTHREPRNDTHPGLGIGSSSPKAVMMITDVQTALAPRQDYNATPVIQQALAERRLLPAEQFADAAIISGHLIVKAREEFDLDLVGLVMPDTSWQAAAGQGFDLSNFQIDWASQQATCPAGQTSSYWQSALDRSGHPVIDIRFSARDCQPCPHRLQCTRDKAHGRKLGLRPQKEHETIQQARVYQQTDEFKERYKIRVGVEGTMSQSAVALGMRRSRFRGMAKTRLQHLVTAAAINVKRAVNWLSGVPLAQTRQSHFAALMA